MNRHARIVLPAALAVGLVVVAASPAVAIEDDAFGSNIRWIQVEDQRPYIEDAQSAYPNLLSTGVALPFGWTGDALDGMMDDFQIEGEQIDWTPAAGGAGWVDGGLSSFLYDGVAPDFDLSFQIRATLEIQGNYARWTFTPVAGPVGSLELGGELGSDGFQTATIVTANSAVVSSDDNVADPVIGYWFSGASGILDVTPGGSDSVYWSAATSAPAVAVVALQDYAPCAESTAVSEMVARVANLNSTFGQAIEGALECATVATPAALEQGTAASQSLPVTVDPAVEAWLANPWQANSRGDYLADPTVVGSAFVGGPAGVSFAFDAATGRVAMSGTPTAAGTFDVALVLYLTDVEDYWDGDEGNGYPLVARFTVEVAAPALANSGTSEATPFVAGFALLLILAGGAVLTARRVKTRR